MPVIIIENDLFDVVIMVAIFDPSQLALMVMDKDGEQVGEVVYLPIKGLATFLEVINAKS